jgi:hypothetical protein
MPRDHETPSPSYDTDVLRATIEPGDEHRLVLVGELDLHGITAFTRAVGDLLHHEPARVAIDLTPAGKADAKAPQCNFFGLRGPPRGGNIALLPRPCRRPEPIGFPII